MPHVLFYRQIFVFTGGHLKVWDYFNHVLTAPGYTATVRFTRRSKWDERNPWSADRARYQERRWRVHPDIHFLAGKDWRFIAPRHHADSPVPIINLIQHVRHADPDDPRHPYLRNRAIRICVSEEIRRGLAATGQVSGPLISIPAGIDLADLPEPSASPDKALDLLVVANKQPDLGRRIHERLASGGRPAELIQRKIPRRDLLAAINRARVTVFVPNPTEGFFLPALEGMALGTTVVCPDVLGNRSFCLPGENCLRPAYDADSIVAAGEAALVLSPQTADRLRQAGRETVAEHSLERERASFLDVLYRVPELWREV
ncbi:MAG: glycosyltransferase [Acidimicrobiia bacterium]